MTTLERRLRNLGEHLDVDDADLSTTVVARLGAITTTRPVWPAGVLRIAAAVVVVVALAVAIVPSSRRAVADWLGFDGVELERRPGIDVPATPDPLDRPGGSTIEIDGIEILVSELVGTLDNPGLSKTLGGGTDVVEVEVSGEPAIWIDGDPHQVSFLDPDGNIVFEAFAGNTLLWQDGDVIRRAEGFGTVEDAVKFAESIGT